MPGKLHVCKRRDATGTMTQQEIRKILDLGVLLSTQRDQNKLLAQILDCMMDLAHCDAGTLYLLKDNALEFRILRNDTLGLRRGENGQPADLPPVPLSRENLCARSVLEGRTIRIDDVPGCSDPALTGPARYDALTGYCTRSMLVVSMQGRGGEPLGALQLINALGEDGQVQPFSEDMTLVLESAASQAALTIQNSRYVSQIRELFNSFVRVMSSAIDARSPYNGNHTKHMAACGERFLHFLNQRAAMRGEPIPFEPQRAEEFLTSVWLHDIGKLVIPLEIMDKPARLLPGQRSEFFHRMERIRLLGRIDALSGGDTDPERLAEETRRAEELVNQCDTAGYLTDKCLARLEQLAQKKYTGTDGMAHPWLEKEELKMLSIRKGTLSDEERQKIQDHVRMTDHLLSQIDLPAELSHVRLWAGAHHEFLDGSGYAQHLKGEQIPFEVRLLTILDIFDALTAADRPYKPGMSAEKALNILKHMAQDEGKLDAELVELFAESQCWNEENGGVTPQEEETQR